MGVNLPEAMVTAIAGAVEHFASRRLGATVFVIWALLEADASPTVIAAIGAIFLVGMIGLHAWEMYLTAGQSGRGDGPVA